MAIKKRAGSDCLRQLPHEIEDPKVSENFHFLAQWLAEVDCRETVAPLDCERLLELWDECDLCEKVCECVCPGETRTVVKFDGIPFENIYVGDGTSGTNWIGNVAGPGFGETTDYVKIFDPDTGVKLASLISSSNNDFDHRSGYGMAYDPTRDVVWVSGFGHMPSNPAAAPLVLRKHHAKEPFTLLAEYRLEGYRGGLSQAPIEFCPTTGDVYAAFKGEPGTTPSGGEPGVLRIDGDDGTVLGVARPANHLDFAGGTPPSFYMVWHPGQQQMVVGDTHDRTWAFDPDTLDATDLGGAVANLVKGTISSPHPEPTYSDVDGMVYLAPQRYGSIWRFPFVGGGSWPTSLNATEDELWHSFDEASAPGSSVSNPNAHFCFYLSPLEAIVASRGSDSVLWKDPTRNGLVTVLAVADESTLREYVTGFNPARSCYCEAQDKLSVVSDHLQDTEHFVEFIPLAEDADATIRNPRDEDGEEVPDGGPYTPPADPAPSPVDPTTPKDPTSPGSTPGTTAPCGSPPSLLSARVWCEEWEDADNPGVFNARTGWEMEIQPVYCNGPGGSNNQAEIVGWNAGLDPNTDPPSERFQILSPAGPPTLYRKAVFTRAADTNEAGAPPAPVCGGITSTPTRVTRTYYVRRNQPGESGPGDLSAESFTLTITDPAT